MKLSLFTLMSFLITLSAWGIQNNLYKYKLNSHQKKVGQYFFYDSNTKTSLSENCYNASLRPKNCLARNRFERPTSLKKFKKTHPNASIGKSICENNLSGQTIYLSSEKRAMEDFCFFKEDNSSISNASLLYKYGNLFIE